MKKIMTRFVSITLLLTLLFTICTPLSYAYSTNKNLLICNSTLSSAHFIDENTYINKRNEVVSLSTQSSSNWFCENFKQICEFKWINNPKDPITVEDFLLLLYHMQMSAEPDKVYPRRELDFEDLEEYYYAINMVQILSSTGSWNNPSILSGTKTDTGIRLNLTNNLTRAQAAKIIDTACNDWYKLKKIRNSIKFTDINNSWAKEYINNAYEYGFINGKLENTFEPDSYLSIEEALTILYNIMEATDKYTINNFVSAVNNNDIGKIIKVYSADFTDTLGTKLPDITYYYNEYDATDELFFTSKDFPRENTIKYKDKTLYSFYDTDSSLRIIDNIYSFLSDEIGPIKIIPPDDFGIDLEEDGDIYFWHETRPDKYEFKIINEFGIEETLTLNFYSKPTDLPLKRDIPNKPFWFKKGSLVICNVGESIDLNEYVLNFHGPLHIVCENPKYTEFDGVSKITLIKQPPNDEKYGTDFDTIYISDNYNTLILFIRSYPQ